MGSGSDLPSLDICLLVIAIRLSGLNVQKLVLYVKIFIHFTNIDLGLLQWPYVVSIIAVNLRRVRLGLVKILEKARHPTPVLFA